MAADPWPGSVRSPRDPAALGLVLPSSSYPAGNDTKLGSSPFSGCTGQVFYQMIHRNNAEFKKSSFLCSKPEDFSPCM